MATAETGLSEATAGVDLAAIVSPRLAAAREREAFAVAQETLPPGAGLDAAPCPTCSGQAAAPAGYPFVYAIGRVEARFPRADVEKEFAQATSLVDAAGKTDREAFHATLSERGNRYLVKKLCWVFRIQGLETYLLNPRDPFDYDLLVEAIRPRPSPLDLDVVIGELGPVASADRCNGLMIPIVSFDQIYSFDRGSLVRSIPRPDNVPAEDFERSSEELLDRFLQLTDNAGATDEHRALNYLAMRYSNVYSEVSRQFAKNASLTAVDVRPSPLSGVRKIVECVLSFSDRATDIVEKRFVRVDVTEEFPFLVTKLAPYYDR